MLSHYYSYSSPAVIAFHFLLADILQTVLSVAASVCNVVNKKINPRVCHSCCSHYFWSHDIQYISEKAGCIRNDLLWLRFVQYNKKKKQKLLQCWSVGRLVHYFYPEWNICDGLPWNLVQTSTFPSGLITITLGNPWLFIRSAF